MSSFAQGFYFNFGTGHVQQRRIKTTEKGILGRFWYLLQQSSGTWAKKKQIHALQYQNEGRGTEI